MFIYILYEFILLLVARKNDAKPKTEKTRQKLSIGHKFEIIMLRESPNYKNLTQQQFCDVVSNLYKRKISRRMLKEMFDTKDMIVAAVSVGDFDPYATHRLRKPTKAKISHKLAPLPLDGPRS